MLTLTLKAVPTVAVERMVCGGSTRIVAVASAEAGRRLAAEKIIAETISILMSIQWKFLVLTFLGNILTTPFL
jgi:hypothetical protein